MNQKNFLNYDQIVVFGASGHARVVIDALTVLGAREQLVVVDDRFANIGSDFEGVPLLGGFDAIRSLKNAAGILALGANQVRARISVRFEQLEWLTVVHPAACISSRARLGRGSVVMAGAVIQAGAILGEHCIVNTRASVDHDCIIGDFSHIGPSACLAGSVIVGQGAFFGVASCAIPGIRVGAWSTLGAGAVAVRDVPDLCTVVGTPARVISSNVHL
jgi:sugar O-acyltransferase (sialic acid O-acetyltransferase NeuD family)